MGMITNIIGKVIGSGVDVREVLNAVRPDAEASDARDFEIRKMAVERAFKEIENAERSGWFDSFVNGLNRLPRPALALGVITLFFGAFYDPLWFAERMQGLALVPEPMWWLMGVIVTFYFGARHQVKSQSFSKSVLQQAAAIPQVVENLRMIDDEMGRRAPKEEVIPIDLEPSIKKKVSPATVSSTSEDSALDLFLRKLKNKSAS